jgi:putative aldouronate transport system substrate-binding protein
MLPALTWLRTAAKDGLLDPEYANSLTNYEQIQAKFTQNIFGIIVRPFSSYWVQRIVIDQFGGSHSDPLSKVGYIPPLATKAGGTPYYEPFLESCGMCFRYDLSDEKLEKLLAIAEWISSSEGSDLLNWGIEGVDWKKNADGSREKYSTENELRAKYPSIFIQNWPNWRYEFDNVISPDFPKEIKDRVGQFQQASNKAFANSKINEGACYIITDERTSFDFNDGTVVYAKLVEIISGSQDVAAMYRAFVTDAYNRGAQAVIDSVNKKL